MASTSVEDSTSWFLWGRLFFLKKKYDASVMAAINVMAPMTTPAIEAALRRGEDDSDLFGNVAGVAKTNVLEDVADEAWMSSTPVSQLS